jgi:hypothetical protein
MLFKPNNYASEQTQLSQITVALLVLAAGALYAIVHIANDWLFHFFELSDHINIIYLPSFLRVINVLVLGMLWGSLGTATGGLILFFYFQDTTLLSTLNTAASAGCAALSLWLLQILQQRPLALTKLNDLLKLALMNALLNALLHHSIWALLDPSQLVSSTQVAYMVIGDINGSIVGALLLRWLALHTRLINIAQQQVANTESH